MFATFPWAFLLFCTSRLASGEIDEPCDEEKQPAECEALALVYDAWDLDVEDYCDYETDPGDIEFTYGVCDDAGHVVNCR